MHRWLIVFAVTACSRPAPVAPPAIAVESGRYREDVEAQVKPLLDAELISGLVVGLYNAGKIEVYGFGRGPGGAAPDGNTLFELGPVTQVYTNLLLADAVQRREVELDTPVSELLPAGVTVPVRDKVAITLKHLSLHVSGLPRVPAGVVAADNAQDPYGTYSEDTLYSDLIGTELETTPGTQIAYSTFGSGLLGFALGRKLGGGFGKALTDRVLRPLELKDTFLAVPEAASARRAAGTTDDLAPAQAWTFNALAGAGAVVSTVHDQLRLIDAELDAAAGSTQPLRRAMKLTQEGQLDSVGENQGLGWMIDSAGRCWHNGSTGGFRAYIGFDPKNKRGIVVLAATATSVVDRLVDALYKILDGAPPPPVKLAGAAELPSFAGTYALGSVKLKVVVDGKRMYLEGPGEPRHRMAPLSDHQFWIEGLQSLAEFEKSGDKVARVVFAVGGRTMSAARESP